MALSDYQSAHASQSQMIEENTEQVHTRVLFSLYSTKWEIKYFYTKGLTLVIFAFIIDLCDIRIYCSYAYLLIEIFPLCLKFHTHHCVVGLIFLFQPSDRDRNRTAVGIVKKKKIAVHIRQIVEG